jgi:hypothetical protein
MRTFTTIAALVLGFIALGHAFRFVRGLEVVIAGKDVPLWISAVVAVVFAFLALMTWRESRRP